VTDAIAAKALKATLLAAPLLLTLGATAVRAQNAAGFTPIAPPAGATPPQGFSGKGQLGYATSTGNSAADNGNAKIDLAEVIGSWKDLLHAEALYAKSADVVSAERWLGTFQTQYQLTKPLFVFGQLMDTEDKFSGFAYQASATAGIGYNLLATHANMVAVQLGAGYRSLRPETLTPGVIDGRPVIFRTPLPTSDSAIGTASINAEHDFNASLKVTDKALTEFGPGDTLLENDFALQVQMSRRLALSAGYSVQDNSTPPPGVKRLETFTTLNLVFTL